MSETPPEAVWPEPEPTPWAEDTTVVRDEDGDPLDGSVTT